MHLHLICSRGDQVGIAGVGSGVGPAGEGSGVGQALRAGERSEQISFFLALAGKNAPSRFHQHPLHNFRRGAGEMYTNTSVHVLFVSRESKRNLGNFGKEILGNFEVVHAEVLASRFRWALASQPP